MWLPVCRVRWGGAQEVLQGPLGSASAPTPQPRRQFLPLLISAALLPSLCGEQAQLVGPPTQGRLLLLSSTPVA